MLELHKLELRKDISFIRKHYYKRIEHWLQHLPPACIFALPTKRPNRL